MNLDSISAAVRPRTHWEAIDLGFMMAREWWKPLIISWIAITLPFFILINTIFIDHLSIAAVIMWWLKPLWERVPLYILSRALFGEIPTLKSTLKFFLKFFNQSSRFQTMLWLTLCRLKISRSLDLPCTQLEGLKGKALSQRWKLLHKNCRDAAMWLTLVCVHLELFIVLAIVVFIYMFIPAHVEFDFWGSLTSQKTGIIFCSNFISYVGMTLVAPFYIAGGFSLYINRRTQLEAWDIELEFRRLHNRHSNLSSPLDLKISKNVTAIIFTATILFNASHNSFAVSAKPKGLEFYDSGRIMLNSESSKKAINGVLEGKEFHQIKTTKSLPALDKLFNFEDDDDGVNDNPWFDWDLGPLPDWIGDMIMILAKSIKGIIICAVIALIIIVFIRYRFWLDYFSMPPSPKRRKSDPQSMFGFDVREENLPDDIPGTALALAQKNEWRSALGLLYRGSLVRLIAMYDCEFKDGHTEGDCVTIVRSNLAEQIGKYFTKLTVAWQNLAYGHRDPDYQEFEKLCRDWSLNFDKYEKN